MAALQRSSQSMSLLLLLLLLLHRISAKPVVKSIQYYAHVKRGGTVVLPPADPVSSSSFGSMSVYSVLITQEPSLESKHVGSVKGLEVRTDPSPNNATSLVLWTVTYSDGKLNGTIQLQGQFPTLSVVGGTQDFAAASGILSLLNVGQDEVGNINHHTITFFDACTPSTSLLPPWLSSFTAFLGFRF